MYNIFCARYAFVLHLCQSFIRISCRVSSGDSFENPLHQISGFNVTSNICACNWLAAYHTTAAW